MKLKNKDGIILNVASKEVYKSLIKNGYKPVEEAKSEKPKDKENKK